MIWINASVVSTRVFCRLDPVTQTQKSSLFQLQSPRNAMFGLVKFPSTWHPLRIFSENIMPDSSRLSWCFSSGKEPTLQIQSILSNTPTTHNWALLNPCWSTILWSSTIQCIGDYPNPLWEILWANHIFHSISWTPNLFSFLCVKPCIFRHTISHYSVINFLWLMVKHLVVVA